jgi:hypothetical protein
MKRAGQILLEILVAAILLALVIPHIGPLCWQYFGPDWSAYAEMVAQNRALLIANQEKAAYAEAQREIAAMERLRKEREHDAAVAFTKWENQQAKTFRDAFTPRQASLFDKCSAKANGKLTQSQTNRLIRQIWRSERYVTTCQELVSIYDGAQ